MGIRLLSGMVGSCRRIGQFAREMGDGRMRIALSTKMGHAYLSVVIRI